MWRKILTPSKQQGGVMNRKKNTTKQKKKTRWENSHLLETIFRILLGFSKLKPKCGFCMLTAHQGVDAEKEQLAAKSIITVKMCIWVWPQEKHIYRFSGRSFDWWLCQQVPSLHCHLASTLADFPVLEGNESQISYDVTHWRHLTSNNNKRLILVNLSSSVQYTVSLVYRKMVLSEIQGCGLPA